MMKISIQRFVAASMFSIGSLSAAPLSLTVSPPTITNNYVGSILLSISNLSASGGTVRVDRFLDVSSNGFVGSNSLVGPSFFVTDGQEPTIAGVRNANMPGDDDGTANQTILTHVPYPSADLTLDHISGQYIYRVTDLNNNQTATAILGLAQQVLPEGIQGRVFAPNGTPQSNAIVVAVQQNGNSGYGAVTSGSGNFTVYAPPGPYMMIAVCPGQLANPGQGLTVSQNSFVTQNLTNVAANGTTISGKVADLNSGAGLPGISIEAQSDSGLFAITASSTNGDFTLSVNSDQWKVQVGGSGGAVLGYCEGPDYRSSVNASSGSVSNVNFDLIRGTALVYGTVKTAQSNAVPGVEMDAQDTNNSVFQSHGVTDANGNYSMALVPGGDSAEPDSSSLAGFVSPQNDVFIVTNGQAVQENFVLQGVSAYLSGIVQDNFGNPIGNINMVADPTNDPTGALDESFQSAPDGTFSIGVGTGGWNLALECNAADSSDLISESLTVDVTSGVNVSNIVLVAQHATATISGRVTDSSGHPLANVNIFANAYIGPTNYVAGCVSTDTNGDYSIPVFGDEWSVGGNAPGMTNQSVTVTDGGSATLNFGITSQSAPPSLGNPVLSGGQIQFQVNGNNGQNYRIDTSTSLQSAGWTPVYTNTGSFPFSAAVTNSSKTRFYRAVAIP